MIYGHGDDIFSAIKKPVANFSTNVWYGGPDPGLIKSLQEQISSIKNYPEPNAQPLREACAKHHNLEAENFLINNGTTESIYQIFQAFHGTSVLIPVPTFAEYGDAAKLYQVNCKFITWEEILNKKNFESKVICICNPNNPTGHVLSKERIENWAKGNPNTTFIIDEAYHAFTDYPQSVIALVNQYRNLIILKSLTKEFAIPGLRIGYIAAHKEIISKLLKYKLPWSVNALALYAGLFIFENHSHIKPNVKPLLTETKWLQTQINSIDGYRSLSSETTFFLIESTITSAKELKKYLFETHHILIRDASNFKGLDEGHFRIATQTREENVKLINALRSWKA